MKLNKTYIFILVMILVSTLIYLNHFDNSFHYDDKHTIQNNEVIRDLNNIPKFFTDGSTFSTLPLSQSYRPLVTTTLSIDYAIAGGLDTFIFHLDNFIFYLLLGILLFFFNRTILTSYFSKSNSFYFASFATLFFMVHPAIAETVNYIISRSVILSTFFVLLAFILYQNSAFSRKYYLYLIPCFIAILAKEPAIMFIPLLLLYQLLFNYKLSFNEIFKKEKREKFLRFLKQSIVPVLFCFSTYGFLMFMKPTSFDPGGSSVYNYIITQPFVFCYYIGSLILPLGLNMETDWQVLTNIWNYKFLVGTIVIVTLLYVAAITSKKKKYRPISFGILWFFLALLPTSSFIPLVDVKNDHRMFFPFIGLIIAFFWPIFLLITNLKLNKKLKLISAFTGVLIIGIYGYGTVQRNKVWKNQETLWLDVVEKSPENAKALVNVGMFNMDKNNYKEAEEYYLKAMSIAPNYPLLYVNYGRLKQKQNKMDEAEALFKKAIDLRPSFHPSWHFYGEFYKSQNKYENARVFFEKAVSLSNYIEGKYALMDIYEKTEKWDNLRNLTQQILKVNPQNVAANKYLSYADARKGALYFEEIEAYKNPTIDKMTNLSISFYEKGDYLKSLKAAKLLVKLDSNSYIGYNNMCACYLKLKDFEVARKNCEKVVRLKPDYIYAWNNLKNIASTIGEPMSLQLKEELVQAFPDEKNYLDLSFTYFSEGDYDNCISLSKKGLKRFPNSFGLYNNISISYLSKKEYALAEEACLKGLQISPNNKTLSKNLKIIQDAK